MTAGPPPPTPGRRRPAGADDHLEQAVGWSALVAAVATVIGAVTLPFFQRGEPWGTRNDIAAIA